MSSFLDKNFFIGKNLGKYKIVDIIGVGGMGVVYRGVHTLLEREVAIKLVLPLKMDPNYTRRFFREAKLLAELKHPNIIEIFDFDFTEEGHYPYYVMELLKGESLRDRLSQYPKGMDPYTFCTYMMQISSALSYAHKKGIVHRDLKPSNIFISKEDGIETIKILDFGIAKLYSQKEDEKEKMNLTATSEVLGTPHYIAPEQVMKDEIGPHTDIYALGLIAAEMLTGKPVRESKTLGEIIVNEIRKPVKLTEGKNFPPYIVKAIEKATQPEIEKRYKDALSFFQDICQETPTIKVNEETVKIKRDKTLTKTLTEGKKKKLKINKRYLLFIPLIALITALIFHNFFLKKKKEFKPGLFLIKKIDIPIDVKSILTEDGSVIALKGNGKIYTLNPDTEKITTISLQDGEIVKTNNMFNEYFSINNNKLYLKKLTSEANLILENLPTGDLLEISNSGKTISLLEKNKINVYRIVEKRPQKVMEIPLKENYRVLRVKLTDNFIYLLTNTLLTVYDFTSKKIIYKYTFKEFIGNPTLALEKTENILAVGGWTDKIFLFNLKKGEKKTFTIPHRTFTLKFLPLSSKLVIGKDEEVVVLSNGKRIYSFKEKGSDFSHIFFSTKGILAINNKNSQLYIFKFAEFPIKKKIKISNRELWSMANYNEDIFAGGRDGVLYKYNIKKDKIEKIFSFNDGIPYIAVKNNKFLIATSDDRTIGIFSLPQAKLLMRSKAHSYLVNYLFNPDNSPYFWTSSSDGTIKKWSLPYLDLEEEISLKEKPPFAGFLVKENLLLAGSWNHKLFILKKEKGKWMVSSTYKVESTSIYQMHFLEDQNLAIGIGIYPSIIYIYNLDSDKLFYIPANQTDYSWMIKDGKFVYFLGKNCIGKFYFKKKEDKVEYKFSQLFNSDIEIIYIGIKVKDKMYSLGNSTGEISILNKESMNFPEPLKGFALPVKKINQK